jgi:hypothetical protein
MGRRAAYRVDRRRGDKPLADGGPQARVLAAAAQVDTGIQSLCRSNNNVWREVVLSRHERDGTAVCMSGTKPHAPDTTNPVKLNWLRSTVCSNGDAHIGKPLTALSANIRGVAWSRTAAHDGAHAS